MSDLRQRLAATIYGQRQTGTIDGWELRGIEYAARDVTEGYLRKAISSKAGPQ